MHPTIFTKKLQVVHIPKAVSMSRSQASITSSLNLNEIQVAINKKKKLKLNAKKDDTVLTATGIKIQRGIPKNDKQIHL